MLRAILMRAGQALLGLFALTLLLFTMVRLTGDPAYFLTGPGASIETLERVRARLGLDHSLPVQYFTYIRNLLTGDLGDSFRFGIPVSDLVLQRLPATLTMAIAASGHHVSRPSNSGCARTASTRPTRKAAAAVINASLLSIEPTNAKRRE